MTNITSYLSWRWQVQMRRQWLFVALLGAFGGWFVVLLFLAFQTVEEELGGSLDGVGFGDNFLVPVLYIKNTSRTELIWSSSTAATEKCGRVLFPPFFLLHYLKFASSFWKEIIEPVKCIQNKFHSFSVGKCTFCDVQRFPAICTILEEIIICTCITVCLSASGCVADYSQVCFRQDFVSATPSFLCCLSSATGIGHLEQRYKIWPWVYSI